MTQLPSHSRSLRADAAADFGHVVGGLRDFVGFFEAALGGELQPVGNVVRERAVNLAEGHAALGATRSLFGGLGGDEFGIDFMEVASTLRRWPLFGRLLFQGDKAQQSSRPRPNLSAKAGDYPVIGPSIIEETAAKRAGFLAIKTYLLS